jgi:hypothetical protein
MMISWWSKHVGVILSVLMCDIWINVLLHTSALVGQLYIVNWNARWNSEIPRIFWGLNAAPWELPVTLFCVTILLFTSPRHAPFKGKTSIPYRHICLRSVKWSGPFRFACLKLNNANCFCSLFHELFYMSPMNCIWKVLYVFLDITMGVVWRINRCQSFGNPFRFCLQGRNLWHESSSKLRDFRIECTEWKLRNTVVLVFSFGEHLNSPPPRKYLITSRSLQGWGVKSPWILKLCVIYTRVGGCTF